MRIKPTYLLSLIIIIIFQYLFFGFAGIKFVAALLLLIFLPIYLILLRLNLEKDEKIFFSLFLGIGIFPSFIYLVGLLVGSIKVAILIFIVVFYGAITLMNTVKFLN